MAAVEFRPDEFRGKVPPKRTTNACAEVTIKLEPPVIQFIKAVKLREPPATLSSHFQCIRITLFILGLKACTIINLKNLEK